MIATVNEQLTQLGIPYAYMEWTQGVNFPYCVGECIEFPTENEHGCTESTFILTVVGRNDYAELYAIRDIVLRAFPPVGKAIQNPDGSVVVIHYSDSLPIPSEDTTIKRLQINLDVFKFEEY